MSEAIVIIAAAACISLPFIAYPSPLPRTSAKGAKCCVRLPVKTHEQVLLFQMAQNDAQERPPYPVEIRRLNWNFVSRAVRFRTLPLVSEHPPHALDALAWQKFSTGFAPLTID
jgi:hypothetical protein